MLLPMKLSNIFFSAMALLSCTHTPPAPADLPKTIYDYKVEGLTGGTKSTSPILRERKS